MDASNLSTVSKRINILLLYTITEVAGLLLSCVTWALLKLLVRLCIKLMAWVYMSLLIVVSDISWKGTNFFFLYCLFISFFRVLTLFSIFFVFFPVFYISAFILLFFF